MWFRSLQFTFLWMVLWPLTWWGFYTEKSAQCLSEAGDVMFKLGNTRILTQVTSLAPLTVLCKALISAILQLINCAEMQFINTLDSTTLPWSPQWNVSFCGVNLRHLHRDFYISITSSVSIGTWDQNYSHFMAELGLQRSLTTRKTTMQPLVAAQ